MESWNDLGSGVKLGTTARGIGPTYSDKMNRYAGVRVSDLLEFDLFRKKIDFNLEAKDYALSQVSQIDKNALLEQYYEYSQLLKPHVIETPDFMHRALKAEKQILFEGAQGTMLDIDFGTYPYVTSSNTTVGAICTGLGVGVKAIDEVLGVTKAYVTRVGAGPFPTEMPAEIDEEIRDIGKEYGATTGRPRRCGWLDLVALQYASRINGLTATVLSKVDVLDHLDEIKVCTGYKCNGKELEGFPTSLSTLEACSPVYETLPGWKTPTVGLRQVKDLPEDLKDYCDFIAQFLEVPIAIVSVGPERDQTLVLDETFI